MHHKLIAFYSRYNFVTLAFPLKMTRINRCQFYNAVNIVHLCMCSFSFIEIILYRHPIQTYRAVYQLDYKEI